MATDLELIQETLELAAERVDDLVPLVYERFFALRPDVSQLLGNDALGRGRMFNETLKMILECAQEVAYLEGIVEREVQDHQGYGATPSMYASYFDAIGQTLLATLGASWRPDHEKAWRRQFNQLLSLVTRYTSGRAVGC